MARQRKIFARKKNVTVYGQSSLRHIVLLGAVWAGVAFALFIGFCAITLPDIEEAGAFKRKPSITILDSDGHTLAEYGERTADPITVKDVPPHLVNALIAVEDRRFYSHWGFDPFGMVRGVVINPILGKRTSGGSTITQQLAKNLFLSPERTAKRKVQELLLALWLEHKYSKEQILEAYLNRVYFGAGAYGVEAAAQTYFGKSARRLNIRESALLVGLLKAPSRYSPRNDIDEAEARTKTVLASMEDAGFLSDNEKRALDKLPVIEKNKLSIASEGRYFTDWVLYQTQELVGDLGTDVIVRTTLNRDAQRAAEKAIKTYLERDGAAQNVAQGAAVLLGRDGGVRAMVGGANYGDSQFNRAVQALRQPGSAFKPFVYLAALENNIITPDTPFEDAPKRYGQGKNAWTPQNYDGKYRGTITAREALAQSVNTVAVQVLDAAGIDSTRRLAHRMGIDSEIEPNLSIALGSSVVTPLELASAYAVIANEGQGVAPYAISEITDARGTSLYKHRSVEMPQIVSSGAVRNLTEMLVSVVDHGTGTAARFGRPIAGKTGTSSDYRDAWFVGFTAHQTLAVWVGNDDNKPMKKVTGGGLPARIWHDTMAAAESGYTEEGLALPTFIDSAPVQNLLNAITGDGEPRTANGEPVVDNSITSTEEPPEDPLPAGTQNFGDMIKNLVRE